MDDSFTVPIPLMTLLTSGKLAAGKQNLIKEVLILPQPGTPVKKVRFLKLTPVDSIVIVVGINYQAFYYMYRSQLTI